MQELTPICTRQAAGNLTCPADDGIETLVQRIVEQIVRELKNQGIEIVTSIPSAGQPNPNVRMDNQDPRTRVERLETSGYRTPILTESLVMKFHELTGTVVVPEGTIVSPKAKELLRDRNINLRIE